MLAPVSGQARRRIHIVPVRNSYFGEPVTVTGLLSGKDIIEALETLSQARGAQGTGPVLAAIPDVVVNRDGVLVDDISLERVKVRASELGIDLEVVRTTADGLYAALTGLAE